jgi:hypothetical protein
LLAFIILVYLPIRAKQECILFLFGQQNKTNGFGHILFIVALFAKIYSTTLVLNSFE